MSDIKLVDAPPGVEGQGFFATSLDKMVGLAKSIHYGLYHSRHHAAASNLWRQWVPTMT